MPQATDIVLDSAGYMIAPGSPQSPGYKRLQDGYPEGLTQRTTLTDFFGGQHRALQLERDKFHDSLCIGPALGGQGVTPWAVHTTFESTPITTFPNREQRIPHVVIKDRLYFAIGTRLYANPYLNYGNPGTFGPALLKDYPNPITDLTIIGSSNLLIAFGSAADILFRLDNGTEVPFATGERAHLIEAYAGYAVWVDARTGAPPSVLRLSKGVGTGVDMRHVSYDVIGMATVGGELMLVTKNALFTFSGSVVHTMVNNPAYNPASPGTTPPQIPSQSWSGEFKPFYQQGVYTERDDFRFITGYGGRTLAWIAGGVHEQVPSGDRAGWRSTGLDGRRCFGGTVAAGYAIVSIESHAGNNELWAYDGNGWWCIARQPMPAGNGTWCNPIGIGTAGSNTSNLMVFTHGSNMLQLFRLVENTHPTTGAYQPAYATAPDSALAPVIILSPDGSFDHASAPITPTVGSAITTGPGQFATAWITATSGSGANRTISTPKPAALANAFTTITRLRYHSEDATSVFVSINTSTGFRFEINTDATLRINIGGTTYNTTEQLTPGQWHTVAVRRQANGNTHIWIDGTPAGPPGMSTPVPNYASAPLNIMGPAPTTRYDLEAVVIYANALTNTEVQRIARLMLAYAPSTTALFAVPASPAVHFTSPMIDAADRDKIKAWRKIGAVFASPELHGDQASTAPVTILLDYSTDAGETWILATAQILTGNNLVSMNTELEAQLAGVTSRFLMLRVRWERTTDWAPILTGLWVEHEALSSPARRRKWQLRIHARDQEVDRDGAMLPRTGRQLIEELWQAWETDTPLTFRDIDYDTDPTQRTVRIVGISEAATQPYDHGMWGDSHITLNLVEV